MLSNKQKRFLRAESHNIQPIFQVGKGGVNENMIVQLNEALEARELIKSEHSSELYGGQA